MEELVDVNVVTEGGLNGNVSPATIQTKIYIYILYKNLFLCGVFDFVSPDLVLVS